MSEAIYQLRHQELNPELAAKLWPFINAYKPHDDIQSWRELRDQGNDPIEKESLLDDLNELYFEQRGYYPDEHPELIEENESEVV